MKFEGLHALALMEGIKGVIALTLVLLVYFLSGQDLHAIALERMRALAISEQSHYAQWLLMLADKVSQGRFPMFTSLALLYASLRFVMAYGLWFHLRWTEWFAFLSGCLYIPVELYAIYQDVAKLSNWMILLFNLIVVSYLFWVLQRDKSKPARHVV
ncbi:DUF2127 domain-containing protein [Marinomonas posidonica]|uniref:DUF2127 domain-containing protein n=1 Tax=Marinomonas posidonica TaxID=936476 RepID=UPI003736BA98